MMFPFPPTHILRGGGGSSLGKNPAKSILCEQNAHMAGVLALPGPDAAGDVHRGMSEDRVCAIPGQPEAELGVVRSCWFPVLERPVHCPEQSNTSHEACSK
jgi:hypothetical protein